MADDLNDLLTIEML